MVYSKYAGTEVKLQDADYVLLKVGGAGAGAGCRDMGGAGVAATAAQRRLDPLDLVYVYALAGREKCAACLAAPIRGPPHSRLLAYVGGLQLGLPARLTMLAGGLMGVLQEDDVIGLLAGSDVAQLQPCQDRVLIEVGLAGRGTAPSRGCKAGSAATWARSCAVQGLHREKAQVLQSLNRAQTRLPQLPSPSARRAALRCAKLHRAVPACRCWRRRTRPRAGWC